MYPKKSHLGDLYKWYWCKDLFKHTYKTFSSAGYIKAYKYI